MSGEKKFKTIEKIHCCCCAAVFSAYASTFRSLKESTYFSCCALFYLLPEMPALTMGDEHKTTAVAGETTKEK